MCSFAAQSASKSPTAIDGSNQIYTERRQRPTVRTKSIGVADIDRQLDPNSFGAPTAIDSSTQIHWSRRHRSTAPTESIGATTSAQWLRIILEEAERPITRPDCGDCSGRFIPNSRFGFFFRGKIWKSHSPALSLSRDLPHRGVVQRNRQWHCSRLMPMTFSTINIHHQSNYACS